MQKSEPALEIRNLRVVFKTYAGLVQAIDGLDLIVGSHELLGLVGESGCGKSVTALAIMGLLPGNARIESGEILIGGKDLLKQSRQELRLARLFEIAPVFQDPMTYLNPVLTIGEQLVEIFSENMRSHRDMLIDSRMAQIDVELTSDSNCSNKLTIERKRLAALKSNSNMKLSRSERKRLARLHSISFLRLVGLPYPDRIMKMYPFELSGGMRQRTMIAMALVRKPKVLIADEITTALDVTVQAQVLNLVKELRDKIDASIILITHDLGVVAQTCDRVAVMYAGNIVEIAPVAELFKNPLHPYTRGLLASVLRVRTPRKDLESISGSVPDLIFPPSGCRFHPRCPFSFDKCQHQKPSLEEICPNHFVACFLHAL